MMAITAPLSGRPAAAMAYKLPKRLYRRRSPIQEVPMTDLAGWKPVSEADDDEEGDDYEEDDDDE